MPRTLAPRVITPLSPTQDPAFRFDPPHDSSDVAKLLRQVTLRAFHAVQPTARGTDLPGVHSEIVALETAIARLHLPRLLTYTSALRRRVESAM